MKTLMIKVDSEKPETTKIQAAAEIIQHGGLVAFPTETVYGLGANALNSDAVLRLFEAKKRPLDNPPIIHIAETKEVYQLVSEVPKKAEILMKQFWPGPLTLVFKRSVNIPKEATAGLDTVAIRIPIHPVAQALIRESKLPIAAPSANLSGKPSPTTAQHVYEDLNGRIDAIISGGASNIGVESTVVDLSCDPPMLLRPGGTPYEALKGVLADLRLHPFVQSEVELPLEKIQSPGMKHKHYAPKAEVILVEGNIEAVVAKIKTLMTDYKDKKVGVLATDETQTAYKAFVVKSMGSRHDISTIAASLFHLLREADSEGVDIILAESVPHEGIGLAVMNRLRKASGYHIIKASL
jgi:L-threonylcarbamoyladenylate synthase